MSDLVDNLRQGVINIGIHEDNSTELYDVSEADDLMFEAAAHIERIEALNERYREALEAIELGDYPRPLGKSWRIDGKPSKYDRCVHDVGMNEVCENCLDAFVNATLASPADASLGEVENG